MRSGSSLAQTATLVSWIQHGMEAAGSKVSMHHGVDLSTMSWEFICEFWWHGFKFKSFSIRSSLLTMGHQDQLTVSASVSVGNDQQRRKQPHMIKLVFFRPLCGWSLIFTRADACFAWSCNAAFHGGSLLNHSLNTIITWAVVWPVHGLNPPTYLLLTALKLNNSLYQSQSQHNWPSLTMFCDHVQLTVFLYTSFEFQVYYRGHGKLLRGSVSYWPPCTPVQKQLHL